MGPALVDNAALKAEIEQFLDDVARSRATGDPAAPGGGAVQPGDVDSVQRLSRIFKHLDGLQDILHDLLHDWEPPQVRARPLCDIPSGCCSFTGPWTVTRSSLRMLRRVAAFCRPLRPLLLLVSFPRSRSPVVGLAPPPPPLGNRL